MSVILVAVLLLARAEAGELELKRGKIVPGSEVRLPAAAQLKSIREELLRWGLEKSLEETLELLIRAGLLVKDAADKLRPTPTVYSWLALPPDLAIRFLVESAGILPNPAVLLSLKRGVLPEDVTIGHNLKLLSRVGLVRWRAGVVYAGELSNVRLLEAIAAATPELELDDPRMLSLGEAWQQKFVGGVPGKGWLRWHAQEFSYSFALPEVGEPPTFDPWQLFRLLSLCQPVASVVENCLCFTPTRERVLTATLSGKSLKVLLTYLEEGLAQPLPGYSKILLKQWVESEGRFRVREVVIVEALERKTLKLLLSDHRIRGSLGEVLSPRHVIIQKNRLGRLQQLLQRRNLFLHLSPELAESRQNKAGVSLALNRFQLQVIVSALLLYRNMQMEMEEGEHSFDLDELMSLLENCLTLREQQEAYRRTNEIQPAGATFPTVTSLDGLGDLQQQLEAAINREAVILIGYTVPGKAAQERWVEPLCVTEEKGELYLTAYCHLRKAQRVFRLDRMQLIKVEN